MRRSTTTIKRWIGEHVLKLQVRLRLAGLLFTLTCVLFASLSYRTIAVRADENIRREHAEHRLLAARRNTEQWKKLLEKLLHEEREGDSVRPSPSPSLDYNRKQLLAAVVDETLIEIDVEDGHDVDRSGRLPKIDVTRKSLSADEADRLAAQVILIGTLVSGVELDLNGANVPNRKRFANEIRAKCPTCIFSF